MTIQKKPITSASGAEEITCLDGRQISVDLLARGHVVFDAKTGKPAERGTYCFESPNDFENENGVQICIGVDGSGKITSILKSK
jgi:hypothetical protein